MYPVRPAFWKRQFSVPSRRCISFFDVMMVPALHTLCLDNCGILFLKVSICIVMLLSPSSYGYSGCTHPMGVLFFSGGHTAPMWRKTVEMR